jgi:hypothetical protein
VKPPQAISKTINIHATFITARRLGSFSYCEKSGGRTKSSGRKKTPALPLILNTPKAAVEYQRGNEKVTS